MVAPNPNLIAETILQQCDIITMQDTKEIFKYNEENGLYEPCEPWLEIEVQKLLGEDATTHYVNETLSSIRRKTYIDRKEANTDINLIPLKNGVYNFDTEELEEYSSDKIFFTKHPISWTNEESMVDNPIDKFIEQITISQEDHLLLKEMIGYCFYRAMPFQNLFLLYGAGGNGKSVLLDIQRNMLGEDNISGQSLQNLTKNRFAPASLYNKNANIFGDLPRTALRDVGVIKELTGGDLITAEQKFKNNFQFYNHAKIIASCNEVPETPDNSDAWYRRIIVINFPNYFGDKPNRTLSKELCTEENLSDFFKSCIGAFKLALQNNELIRKEAIEEKRAKYLHYSNSALAFINDCLELDSEMQIETSVLYDTYVKYCRDRRVVALNEEWFYKKLYKLYPNGLWRKRERNGNARVSFVVGIYWKNEEDKCPMWSG